MYFISVPKRHVFYPKEDLAYPCLDFWATISGLAFYFFDVYSDCYVAYLHYQDRHYWWFGLTVSCILLSATTMTLFSLWWYIDDLKSSRKERQSSRDETDVAPVRRMNEQSESIIKSNSYESGQNVEHEFSEFSKLTWCCRGTFLLIMFAPTIRCVSG